MSLKSAIIIICGLSCGLLQGKLVQKKPKQKMVKSHKQVVIPHKQVEEKVQVDFDISMGKGSEQYRKKFDVNESNAAKLELLKEQYEKNNLMHIERLKQCSIPRVIHQIWVGNSPLPDKYRKLMASWVRHHPGYVHRLWTEKDVVGLKLHNYAFYKATKDPIEKANILRYEILYKHGGLYVDIDTLCLKSTDILRNHYDFYTCICPTDCTAILNNAAIACGPGHPIMEYCIETIKDDWGGATRFERTGVHHFSRAFFEKFQTAPGVTIALPPTYFYPLSKETSHQFVDAFIKPESFSVHYWATVHSVRKHSIKKKRPKGQQRA